MGERGAEREARLGIEIGEVRRRRRIVRERGDDAAEGLDRAPEVAGEQARAAERELRLDPEPAIVARERGGALEAFARRGVVALALAQLGLAERRGVRVRERLLLRP